MNRDQKEAANAEFMELLNQDFTIDQINQAMPTGLRTPQSFYVRAIAYQFISGNACTIDDVVRSVSNFEEYAWRIGEIKARRVRCVFNLHCAIVIRAKMAKVENFQPTEGQNNLLENFDSTFCMSYYKMIRAQYKSKNMIKIDFCKDDKEGIQKIDFPKVESSKELEKWCSLPWSKVKLEPTNWWIKIQKSHE